MMRYVLAICLFTGSGHLLQAGETTVWGFSTSSRAKQLDLEARYDALLKAENLREWMRHMTLRPHNAGSPKAKENAEFMAKLFKSWGYETEIEVYHVLFPTPKIRELTLLEPTRYEAVLAEPVLSGDSVAEAIRAEGLPPFNAFSADGDVTAELVYVNQGIPRDYEVLRRRGIDVKGKIVLARYGGSWRGIKPKVAAEHGAIGCIIFNDPHEDGFFHGDAYPEGSFKHDHAVQRGSVMDLPLRPGDPLTPYRGSTKNAERLSLDEAETIMKIPVLPISYHDAKPLMAAMGGPVAPPSWRGSMPVTYRIGPGPAKVRLKLAFNWDQVPAYNVIAKMKGAVWPDEWVIRGNHHDAWVVGAVDPISGLVPLMEQARAFGELAKNGWKPKRTLVFAAWDAEEPALLGSTEWVEHHARELSEKAVAYINTDGSSRGYLFVGGSHSLERLANEAADAVTDPQTGIKLTDRLRSLLLTSGDPQAKKEAGQKYLDIAALGSGSDFSAFLQHLGIASFHVAFGGEADGGEYHTNFDTFDYYTRFQDTTFEYGVALAKTCGRLTLRLCEAELLPFDFSGSARAIGVYVDEVMELAEQKRRETQETNRLIDEGHFQRTADPTETHLPPLREAEVPYFNFAPLRNANKNLQDHAEAFQRTYQTALDAGGLHNGTRAAVNRLLYQSERVLTRAEGLPRRPWFRHQIYAPGFYTGYGVKTLPGVREAIEERHWAEAEKQIVITAAAIQRLADQIAHATELLKKALP